MPPIGATTTKFEYSNNGYIVVGAMLEAKLSTSWEHLVRTHLFQPLGLLTAGFGAPGRSGATEQPAGHSRVDRGNARQPHLVGSQLTDNQWCLVQLDACT
jgi:CubicO group peptidase (beta-lactamase class C family)